MRLGKSKALDPELELHKLLEKAERLKASVRAKAEHPFRVIKQQFCYDKVRCRSSEKNTARVTMLFALSICGYQEAHQECAGIGAPAGCQSSICKAQTALQPSAMGANKTIAPASGELSSTIELRWNGERGIADLPWLTDGPVRCGDQCK